MKRTAIQAMGRKGLYYPTKRTKRSPASKRNYMMNLRAAAIRTMRPELKYLDTAIDSDFAAIPAISLINGLAEGYTQSTRIGRKINMRSIQMNLKIEAEKAATSSPAFRFSLVYDKQTNGTAPGYTDIYTTAADVTSLRNLNNRDRFKVIYDSGPDYVVMQKTEAGDTPASTQMFHQPQMAFKSCFKKVNLDTIFKDTTAVVGSISTGALFLVSVFEHGDANVSVTGQIRVKYTDV